ncbi:MAG: hypothetical protein ACR2PM_12945, partial [Hyphomicrobiales bacterium]
ARSVRNDVFVRLSRESGKPLAVASRFKRGDRFQAGDTHIVIYVLTGHRIPDLHACVLRPE